MKPKKYHPWRRKFIPPREKDIQIYNDLIFEKRRAICKEKPLTEKKKALYLDYV